MSASIPVRNLWLLMLYAAQILPLAEFKYGHIEANPDAIPDLVAQYLCHLTEQRLHHALQRTYQEQANIQSHVRGRLDVLTTARRQLLAQAKVACRYQQLALNTPLYATVRAALTVSSRQVTQASLAKHCRQLAEQLYRQGVQTAKPTVAELDRLSQQRLPQADQVLLNVARLVFDLNLPNEEQGQTLLQQPEQQLSKIRLLYEKAIAGFYQFKLANPAWQIKKQARLYWPIQQKTAGIDRFLPQMQSDLILENQTAQQRILIDTKFTDIIKAGYHREWSFSSGHIYQLYAYLKSQTGGSDALAQRAAGLLLYPAFGLMLDETVWLQDHAIRFATVDLTASATQITTQLLRLVDIADYRLQDF